MKKIIFKVIPDPSTRYQLLRAAPSTSPTACRSRTSRRRKGNPDIRIVNEPSRNIVFLGMNSQTKPFDNVKVRQAINYAVPYDTIIKQVLLGYGQQMTSPIPLGTPTHTDRFNVYKTDLARRSHCWPRPASRTASPPRCRWPAATTRASRRRSGSSSRSSRSASR